MNTIESVKIIDDRIYLKILFDAIDTLHLRFYVPANKNEFIEGLKNALNHPAITEPVFDWEVEKAEKYYHENIVSGAMDILRNSGFSEYQLTGVFQRKPYGVTDKGKSSYAIFMHTDALGVELIEICPSYEAALLKASLDWRADENEKLWKFKKPAVQRKNYDAIVFHTLHSIDTLDELVKYKNLYDDQLDYFASEGLVA